MITVAHTWHRLNAGLPVHPGAEHQNSYWMSGNKPHPPREVGAFGACLPFLFATCSPPLLLPLAALDRLDKMVRLARRLGDAEAIAHSSRQFDGPS